MKVEVKEAQSNEVDWTKNPQLLYNKHEDTIVMMLPVKETDTVFFGMVMIENHLYNHGYLAEWYKKDFTPFHGEITLKND